MSNPFAKFALKNDSIKKESNAGNSGWLTTKKRGRDDVAIRRDQTKAREAVKQRRRSKSTSKSKSTSNSKSNSKSKRTAKKPPPRTTNRGRRHSTITKKKNNYSSDEEDYEDDSMDDFVVDDDEDLSEEQISSSEDEDLVADDYDEPLSTRRGKQRAAAPKKNSMALSDDEDDDDDSIRESSQDQDTFLVSKDFKSRKSKPMDKRKHLKNISNNTGISAGTINKGTSRPSRSTAKNPVNLAVSSDESDNTNDYNIDDDDFEEEKKWDPQDLNLSSSDDDSLEILESSSRTTTNKRSTKDEKKTMSATKREVAVVSATRGSATSYLSATKRDIAVASANRGSATSRLSATKRDIAVVSANRGSATSRFFSNANSSNQRPTIVTSTRQPPKKNDNSFFMDDDDDDDDEFPMQSTRTITHKKPNTNYNTGKLRKQPIFSDDDDGDDSSDNDIPNYTRKEVDNDIQNGLSLQDTPTPIKKFKEKKKKSQKMLLDDDNDSDDGSDENLAMALAMSQSLIEADLLKQKKQLKQNNKRLKKLENKKRPSLQSFSDDNNDDSDAKDLFNTKKEKNKNKMVKKKNDKNKIVYLDDDSDHVMEEEEEEDDDAEVDAYMEDDAREANSVLNAANHLSAQVLKTMAEWSQVDGGKKASTGMILNGALAIHDFLPPSSVSKNPSSTGNPTESTKNGSGTSSSSWISQDVMKRILPNVKLGDYQLIGVNWLALLHGMKCQVEGSKKSNTMNVNGVLADEMGLGKTVQTIAFLAWLKHRHDDDKKLTRTNSITKESTLSIDSENENKNDEGDNDDDSVVNLIEDNYKNDDDENSASSRRNNTTTTTTRRPHIVIVPASVLSNWQREFEKFCPSMIVVKYHGTMKEREEIQNQLSLSLPTKSAAAPGRASRVRSKRKPLPLDVVLTTFSYFSSEKSTDRSFLRKFHFDYMVVDEAHCLKSAKGMRYRNLNKFKTSHRLLLTGTPVQNSPKELMSLLCFLMPLFSRSSGSNEGDFDDNNKEDHGGESMLQHFVNIESNGKEADSEAAYKKLKHLFAPFVLRRRKVDVLSQLMPPKTRKVEWVPFDDSTRYVYDSIVASHMQRREDKSAAAEQHLFTALRKAANHPLLLRTRHKSVGAIEHLAKQLYQAGYFGRDDTCTVKLVQKELEGFSDFDIHCAALELIEENPRRSDALSRYTLKAEDLFCSPKCKRLSTLLPELLQDGHRILIFSQWTRCLDLLGCLLDHLDLKYLRLDGQTVISERQRLIDEFNEDASIPVFLLSTRAGGMGINLTAADTCILHDLDFNPFNDIQAEDRCHRIGQKKPVSVIKMITEKTVDADIYEMQQRKAKMNAAILENGSSTEASNSVATAGKKKPAKEEKEEINKMLKKTFDRYLHSPAPKDDKIVANSPDILV